MSRRLDAMYLTPLENKTVALLSSTGVILDWHLLIASCIGSCDIYASIICGNVIVPYVPLRVPYVIVPY